MDPNCSPSYLSVDDFVPAQRARLSESFPANFAHEWSRAGVHGHVACQVVMCVKDLSGNTKHHVNNNDNKKTTSQPTSRLSLKVCYVGTFVPLIIRLSLITCNLLGVI